MKTYHLVIKEEAKEEITDAYYWYESKLEGLGNRLLDSINECFVNLIKNPLQFPKKYNEMRQAMIKNFPFVAIFEIEKSEITVYAIFHTSRNPDTWIKRK